ncbi:hypothetical protein SAMN04487783_2763 [Agrococcus baldri]|uniref:Uncharacterized protein n=1 Tax=Agrococcus baldri TaxID=153730 RepID=A0AA94HPP7_9MICO|nr:hypothetical protein [Agrococcus baldri]SFS18870.1 hypothetical protein SAMN04487783_2763 [Agrococcus baldri]
MDDNTLGDDRLGDDTLGDDTLGDATLQAVAALVQHGIVARLWIFLIEPDGTMHRDLQQVDSIPTSPDAYAVLALRGILGHLLDGDQEVVFVIERPAGPTPSPDDWAWHDAIVRAVRGIPVPLRGVLLAHSEGVDAMRPRTLAA